MNKLLISPVNIVEEVINSATHGIGAVFSIIGLILGIMALSKPAIFTVSFILYTSSLIILMLASSIYHALIFTKASKVLRILDHNAIFLLIAGSYTPFIVFLYSGWAKIVLLILIWSLAILGITLKSTIPKAMMKYGMIIYIALGWLALIFIPKLSLIPPKVAYLLFIGGLLYSCGAIFLRFKKPFMHSAWHLFVMFAAGTHYLAITIMLS